jgi:hypothetical protein
VPHFDRFEMEIMSIRLEDGRNNKKGRTASQLLQYKHSSMRSIKQGFRHVRVCKYHRLNLLSETTDINGTTAEGKTPRVWLVLENLQNRIMSQEHYQILIFKTKVKILRLRPDIVSVFLTKLNNRYI